MIVMIIFAKIKSNFVSKENNTNVSNIYDLQHNVDGENDSIV